MIPGNPHPLLMAGGGDPLDDLGVIARALRIRAAASAYLTRTPGVNGNLQKWTMSVWVKRGQLGTLQGLLTAVQGGGNSEQLRFDGGNDTFSYTDGASGGTIGATYAGNHRDPGSYEHFVFSYDSTNATAANRAKLSFNGTLRAQNSVNIALNRNSYINSTAIQRIGLIDGFSNSDFNIAHFVFVDGQALDPTAFGAFNPSTGQWRPKSKSGIRASVAVAGGARNGWGTNGFFLPFDDTTSTTTLCYDRSQSDTDTTGNNWTPTNISLSAGATYDSLTDTPTSNYATLSPLIYNSAGTAPTLSNANMRFTGTGASANVGYAGFAIPESGQWQWEVEPTGGASVGYAGVARTPVQLSSILDLGQSTNDYAYRMSTGNKSNNNVSTAYGAAISVADTLGFVFDATVRTLTAYKNGVSQGVMFSSLPAGTYLPGFDTAGGEYFDVNFGQRAFKYPIAGAKALNTKNLPMPTNGAVIKPSTAFVAVTDSGANVQATLAAARPGWPSYIEIFKRRDAIEGWRWRFSDDLANYLDSSSTAAKAAFPALSGTSYVGYAIKVAAANGVAMGRLTHVNGVADTVTDGLGNVRKAVILKNESTGDWYFYHPDLTAGKLLYLNQTAGETTDSTLGTVLSNSFVVTAALASGTYRWLAFAEVDGFLKLFKYTSNAATNGPFVTGNQSPEAFLAKRIDTAENWGIADAARDPYNVVSAYLSPNVTAADATGTARADFVSSGAKLRTTAGPNTGGTYAGLMFAAFPFRYANAR